MLWHPFSFNQNFSGWAYYFLQAVVVQLEFFATDESMIPYSSWASCLLNGGYFTWEGWLFLKKVKVINTLGIIGSLRSLRQLWRVTCLSHLSHTLLWYNDNANQCVQLWRGETMKVYFLDVIYLAFIQFLSVLVKQKLEKSLAWQMANFFQH